MPKLIVHRQRVTAPLGDRTLGLKSDSTAELVRRVQHGFPYEAINRFHRASGIPVARIAEFATIPPRTLLRRKSARRLTADESERLLRVAAIFETALALFEGDRKAAVEWLSKPARALGGQAPFDFSRTEVGAGEVRDLVGRLEHGVFD